MSRPTELAKFAPRAINQSNTTTTAGGSTVTPLVKHVLSRELQLYFTRLTEALGSSSGGAGNEMREAALGSVRSDPGLHQLVPYLIGWGGEQVRLGSVASKWGLGADPDSHCRRLPTTCTISLLWNALSTCSTQCSKTPRSSSSLT